MLLHLIRNKLGIVEHEKHINDNRQEIEELKRHILEIKKQNRVKEQIRIVTRDRRVDNLVKQVDSIRESQEDIVFRMNNQVEAMKQILDLLESDEFYEPHRQDIDYIVSQIVHFNNAISELKQRLSFIEQNSISTRGVVLPTVRKLPKSEPRIEDVETPDSAVQTADDINTGRLLWNSATDSQKKLLEKMYDLGYPVSYRELARETTKSISTIKNHINNLKSKGVIFNERIGPNNVKKYLLDNRLKTFLTLRLND